MITPLLQTKLHIPPLRSEVVRRPRLIDLVVFRPQLKLVVITAPAGFGKTTLASDWLSQTKKQVAWVSLDEGENDLKRFLLYLLTALHQIAADVGSASLAMLEIAGPSTCKAILGHLINDLADIRTPLVLALDDYHHIQAHEVHEALTFLLDNLPPQLFVVLISRTEPPLPLARLRAKHELVELGASDLRFTWAETEEFLNRTMRLGLSNAQITELESRTEGWITGLQLIALSIRNADDASRLIEEISGDERYIADYLIEEVLSQQPENIERFLLQTSVFARMNADLCDAALETGNSRQTLDTLQRANLFVIPLDKTRTWYRYHHLFAELLNRRLLLHSPDLVSDLHRRAARWFFAHQMPEEAIEHALNARDFGVVTEYLQNTIDDELLAKGRFKIYLEWLDRIPDEQMAAYPKLILYRVFQLWEMQHLEKFNQQLGIIERKLGPIPETPCGIDPELTPYLGILSVIKGIVNCGDFAIDEAAHCFSRALLLLPQELAFWRNLALGATGFCLRIRGNYAAADEYFARVVTFAREAGLVWLCFQYGVARTQVCLALGKLETAMHTCEYLLLLDAQHGHQIPFAGVAYTMMGELLYLSGDLAAAEQKTRRGLELVMKDGDARHIAVSYFNLARIHIARGALSEAVELMDRMMLALGCISAPPSAVLIARAYQAYVWILSDELERAKRWAADPGDARLSADSFSDVMGLPYFGVYCTVYEPYERSMEFIQFTRALYELAAGNAPIAIQRIDELLSNNIHGYGILFRAQVLIARAVALEMAAEPEQAVETLIAAIALSVPEPFLQLFINLGRPIRDLLERSRELFALRNNPAAEEARARAFVEKALFLMAQADALPAARDEPSILDLSPREVEVLAALARGISYIEVADTLLISRNTVKTYLKRIYSKLDATNRLQAVNKAREAGFLA